jgi:23S rRNA pseudouridine1911/1915/1917 synthase
MTFDQPCIIEETDDYAVVFKPPKMHSAPLKKKEGGTLFDWFCTQSSSVFDMVHRLDFETHGLVLIAKNKKSFEFFKSLQDNGEFTKEYSAICARNEHRDSGFPPSPFSADLLSLNEKTLTIESYFRPFGPGRKLVRPVTENKKRVEIAMDRGGFYKTEIININGNVFNIRIRRGFRHQIRCHLCWIGFPVLNDVLYPNPEEDNLKELALRSHALFFIDPSTGKPRECRIESILEKPAF